MAHKCSWDVLETLLVILNIHNVDFLNNTTDILHNLIDIPYISMNILDTHMDILDISMNFLDIPMDVLDVPMNILDIHIDVLDIPMNILDIPMDVLDIPKKSLRYTNSCHMNYTINFIFKKKFQVSRIEPGAYPSIVYALLTPATEAAMILEEHYH